MDVEFGVGTGRDRLGRDACRAASSIPLAVGRNLVRWGKAWVQDPSVSL